MKEQGGCAVPCAQVPCKHEPAAGGGEGAPEVGGGFRDQARAGRAGGGAAGAQDGGRPCQARQEEGQEGEAGGLGQDELLVGQVLFVRHRHPYALNRKRGAGGTRRRTRAVISFLRAGQLVRGFGEGNIEGST